MLLKTNAPAALESELRAHEPALQRIAASAGARLRLAIQMEGDPLSVDAGSGRVILQPNGLVELTADGDDAEPLLRVVREIATELRNAVDWPASAVSVGTVNQVLPAVSDVILLTLAASRLPSITRATFTKYWLNTHAALAMSMLNDAQKNQMGYQQLHANEDASARAHRFGWSEAHVLRRRIAVRARQGHRSPASDSAGLRRGNCQGREELRRSCCDARRVHAHVGFKDNSVT